MHQLPSSSLLISLAGLKADHPEVNDMLVFLKRNDPYIEVTYVAEEDVESWTDL